MTLEQIDQVLLNNIPAKEGRDKIRAMIRAGQTLRDCFLVIKEGRIYPAAIHKGSEVVAACETYDAATRGEGDK